MGWLRELFDRSPRRGHRHAPVVVGAGAVATTGWSDAVETPVQDHASAGRSDAVETPSAYGWSSPVTTAPAPAPPTPARPAPAATLQAPSPQVTLGFRDGSEAHLAPLDPRMRAFLTVADTLRRSES